MILNNELTMALTRFSNEERKHLSQLHAASPPQVVLNYAILPPMGSKFLSRHARVSPRFVANDLLSSVAESTSSLELVSTKCCEHPLKLT